MATKIKVGDTVQNVYSGRHAIVTQIIPADQDRGEQLQVQHTDNLEMLVGDVTAFEFLYRPLATEDDTLTAADMLLIRTSLVNHIDSVTSRLAHAGIIAAELAAHPDEFRPTYDTRRYLELTAVYDKVRALGGREFVAKPF